MAAKYADCKKYFSLAAIVAVFLFCIGFMIIKRWCSSFRRQQRTIPNPNEDAMGREEPSVHVSHGGLASAVIRSLPAFQFREHVKDGSGREISDCAICLVEFRIGEWLRLLPNCDHVFHVHCVDTWFKTNSTCPLCRTNVLYDFGESASPLSTVGLLETLRREDVNRERPLGYRLLDLEWIHDPAFRLGATGGHL